MPSPQKAKGSGWERDVAKYLTELYSLPFHRAPGSGAYVGGRNSSRKAFLDEGQVRSFKGDVVPPKEFPKMNLEAKFYKDFPFHQLFHGEIKILESWLEQMLEPADEGDFSILVMKFNRKGKWVAVRPNEDLTFTRSFTYDSEAHGRWIIMDYDDFWGTNHGEVAQLCK